ncbi:MAG: CHAT domain-containing protein [Saprospiraceae bacterium]|nr:CHAT domain-containing protein [Saprospiraceae bacterium]
MQTRNQVNPKLARLQLLLVGCVLGFPSMLAQSWSDLCQDLNYDSCLKKLETVELKDRNWQWHQFAGNLHLNVLQYEEALEQYVKCLEHLEEMSDSTLTEIYNNLGICADESRQYQLANNYFFKAIEHSRNLTDSLYQLSNIYTNLGILHNKTWNLETALHYQKKTLEIDKKILPPDDPWIETDEFNLSRTLGYLGDQHTEVDLLKKILHKRISRKADAERISNVLTNLSVAYRKLDQIDSALWYVNQALHLDQSIKKTELIFNDYYNFSLAYLRANEFSKASRSVNQMETWLRKSNNHEQTENAKIAFLRAQIAAKLGQRSDAIKYFDMALSIHLADLPQSPSDELNEYLATVYQYAILLSPNDPEYALQIIKEALKLAELKQFAIDQTEGIEVTYENYKKLFFIAGDLTLELYDQTNKYELLADLFQIVEQKKQYILYQNYLKYGQRNSHLPAFVKELGKTLLIHKSKMAHIRHNAHVDKDSISLLKLEKEFITSTLQWREQLTKQKRKDKLPIFEENTPSLSQAITWSKNTGTSILSYLLDDSFAISILITPDTVTTFKYALRSNFTEEVNQYHSSIQTFGSHLLDDEDLLRKNIRQVKQISHSIYRQILEPVEPQITNDVVIIPDEVLLKLPFSTLLRQIDVEADWQLSDFLVAHKQISLEYSISSLLSRRETELPAPLYLLAPFKSNRDASPELYLPGSVSLATEISKNFKVTMPNDDDKPSIIEAFKSGSIIHIASHAFADASQASGYFLAIGPQIEKFDHCLYLDEIYGVQSQAGLIVLDACETGHSNFSSASLSRAFYLSGAQQIISTQWRSSDRASAHLMTQFYEHLAKGKSAIRALTESKRSYLQNHHGIHIHPFFWGSHEIWGWSKNKLKLAWYQKYTGTIGTGLLLLIIGVFWHFYQKRRVVHE